MSENIRVMSAGCVCTDVFVDKNEIRAGGESLNFCGNVCTVPSVECFLIGVVGADEYGSAIRERIQRLPVDISHLHTADGVTANHKIWHTADGDRYFDDDAWDGGVFNNFTLTSGDLELLRTADAVHTHFDAPIFRQVLDLKKDSDFLLAVDFNDNRDFSDWEDLLDDIDLFFISGTLQDDNREILRRWSESHGGVFVQTLAEHGSVAYCGGREYVCHAVKAENVVDTTGAGDSYIAGFVAEYTVSRDVQKAMEQGSALAAVNIARLGGF